MGFVGTNSSGPARSILSLQLDQRSLHFSVSAWVIILAKKLFLANFLYVLSNSSLKSSWFVDWYVFWEYRTILSKVKDITKKIEA